MNSNAPVVTMLYAAICGVLLIVLALNIVRLRRGFGISLGMGEGSALEQPVRVHGNFTEYTPTFLILLLLAELGGAVFWFLHLLGALQQEVASMRKAHSAFKLAHIATPAREIDALKKRILSLESARLNDQLAHKGALDALRERGNELAISLGRLVALEDGCDLNDAEFERRMDDALAAARVRMQAERRRAVALARKAG